MYGNHSCLNERSAVIFLERVEYILLRTVKAEMSLLKYIISKSRDAAERSRRYTGFIKVPLASVDHTRAKPMEWYASCGWQCKRIITYLVPSTYRSNGGIYNAVRHLAECSELMHRPLSFYRPLSAFKHNSKSVESL